MYKALIVSVLFVASNSAAQTWLAPENPDPQEIRRDAERDIEEGRLELAAEKYLWYFNNALEYAPSLSGVRLSFALGDWRDLADRYPPARRDMEMVRDRAEESVRLGTGGFSDFSDFVALNDELDDDGRTVELFKWLDQTNRHLARDVYAVAQDTLVHSGEFALCEKYIVGRNSFQSVQESLERDLTWRRKYSDEPDYEENLDFTYLFFARRAGHIVAVLVNVGKSDDAKVIAEEALTALDGTQHAYLITDALDGIPPERLR